MSRRVRDKVPTPKALFVVISGRSNPHTSATIEVFTTIRKAQRAARWSDQRVVKFVPEVAS